MVPRYNPGYRSEGSQEENERVHPKAARLPAEVVCPRIAVQGNMLGKRQQGRLSYVECQTHQHSLLVHYCYFILLHICYTFVHAFMQVYAVATLYSL